MTMVFVYTLMTTVFVCTLITIIFVYMIINYYFAVVFYINICIAHAKFFIYFTPGNHFTTVGFFFAKITGYRSNRTGIPV